jgi:hypothetical protein
MANTLDTLTAEIGLVVTKIATTDLALLRGYSQAKARAIASYTLLLGEGYAAGTVSDEQMTQEMAELERMVLRFVRNLQALAATTIERILRGIGDLLMTTLRALTGLSLLPLPPHDGTIWGVGPAA